MKAVYAIRNIVNDKIYIGSTSEFNGRFRQHKYQLNHNKHHSKSLQEDWNILGKNFFVYEIIEEVKKESEPMQREQVWFNFFNPEYNVSTDTRSPMKGRKHTEETKAQMTLT